MVPLALIAFVVLLFVKEKALATTVGHETRAEPGVDLRSRPIDLESEAHPVGASEPLTSGTTAVRGALTKLAQGAARDTRSRSGSCGVDGLGWRCLRVLVGAFDLEVWQPPVEPSG